MVEGGRLESDAEPAVPEQAMDAAGDRRGSVVLVSCEPGIGRTSLPEVLAP
jgi:hypothetical protein